MTSTRTCETRVRSGALRSAHDVAEGGLAVALAECCIAGAIGASVKLPAGVDPFAEAPGQAFVVSGDEHAVAGFRVIGRVGGDELEIDGALAVPIAELSSAWNDGLSPFV